MKERYSQTEPVRFFNEYLAPVEHLIFIGGSLELGERIINTSDFLRELATTRKVDPKFLVPISLSVDSTPESFEKVTNARKAKHTFPISFLDEGSQIMFAKERRFIPVVELGPLGNRKDREAYIWRMHLKDRSTDNILDDLEIFRQLKVREDLGDCLTLVLTEEDEMYAVFDPELAAAA